MCRGLKAAPGIGPSPPPSVSLWPDPSPPILREVGATRIPSMNEATVLRLGLDESAAGMDGTVRS